MHFTSVSEIMVKSSAKVTHEVEIRESASFTEILDLFDNFVNFCAMEAGTTVEDIQDSVNSVPGKFIFVMNTEIDNSRNPFARNTVLIAD